MNTQLKSWDEVRTAYHVARLGTLSAAADFLGVHHSTAIRHISALEEQLGVKLFQRHRRGYTPTEAGRELMNLAAVTEDQFEQVTQLIRGSSGIIAGELIVTTLEALSPVIVSWLAAFQRQHPDIRVNLVLDKRRLRLEYGEAHVAMRVGNRPVEPDNVVQHFMTRQTALYAHRDYVDRMGVISDQSDIRRHNFLLTMDVPKDVPFFKWLLQNVPSENVVLRSEHSRAIDDALMAGMGIAPTFVGLEHPDLVQVMPPADATWSSDIWLVTHVDLHRTNKVQACLSFLKEQAALLENPDARRLEKAAV